MRKSTTREDLKKYPVFFYNWQTKNLFEITNPERVYTVPFGYTPHHFIRQQWRDNNPEKYEEVEHLQKLILLPSFIYDGENQVNCHGELHARHSKFKEKYGYEIDELLWNEEE